jgi:outer membrane protein
MTRTAALPLVLLLSASAAAAEAPPDPTRPLGLEEAVVRAREVSPRLGRLRALEHAAEAALRGARAERMPSLGVSAGYDRRSNVPEFVIGIPGQGALTVYPNLPHQGYARAELGLPVYTGGRLEGEIEAAGHGRDAAREDRGAGQDDLVLEVQAAYWELVSQRAAERVLREGIAAYDAHLKETSDRYDTGLAARNDVLAVQVERDRAELARLSAENAAEVANADLLRLLDLDPATRLEPTEPLAAPPLLEETPAVLVAEALERRSELLALRSRAAAADARVKTARAARLPQASLHASYDYANPNLRIFPPESEWNDTWMVGVSVAVNVFDGGRASAATAGARAEAEAERRQIEEAERRTRLEVTARLLDVRTARASLEVAARNVEAARENVRVSQDRYRAGVSPSSDLLDAESALLNAGLDETLALSRVRVARARLDRAVGR